MVQKCLDTRNFKGFKTRRRHKLGKASGVKLVAKVTSVCCGDPLGSKGAAESTYSLWTLIQVGGGGGSCGHPVLLGLCQLVYFLGIGSVRVPLALTVLWFLFFAVHTAWVRPGCVVWPRALVEASLHVFGSAPYYPLCPGLHCWLGPLGVSGFVCVQVPLICVTVVVGARVLEV